MGEIIDAAWRALSDRVEPLGERLRAEGFYYSLHVEINPRYRVFYGQVLLFTEADPERVIAGAQDFVRILEEGSKEILPIKRVEDEPKDY